MNIFGKTLAEITDCLKPYASIYMVCDRNVAGYAHSVYGLLEQAGHSPKGIMQIEASEKNKNIGTITEICRWLLDNNADRDAFLLAVGGGIVSDMAGFAAAIYKRGIKCGYAATTLLAQVDAAIGGKTGVNLDSYKNMLGVIREPEFTFICTEVMQSLPFRDFMSGAAELLKSFIIGDAGKYDEAIALLKEIHSSPNESEKKRIMMSEKTGELIKAAAEIKTGIVGRDLHESGERRKLNLGHTFAHSIEKAAGEKGDDISHGEAVAIGTVMAARLSEKCGTAEEGLADKIENDFKACGLPVKCPYGAEELAGFMEKDKKAEKNIIHFVLIESIGNTVISDMSAGEAVSLLCKATAGGK